jgi:hypothetical protein
MTTDDDDDSQAGVGDETSHDARKPTERQRLLGEWAERFYNLDLETQDAWTQTHLETNEWAGIFVQGIYLEPIAGAVMPTDPAFVTFQNYNEAIRRQLNRAANFHRGSTLDEIEDYDGESRCLLDGVIPANEISVIYGAPKDGKSAWAHKLAICVASDDLKFDGESIPHGRVLFITLDPGARKKQVKARMMQIYDRLNIKPGKNLILVDDPLILDSIDSVASLLQNNPGEFVLVVIDPFYQALSGDPSQAGLIRPAMDGLKEIAVQTGAAVLVLHHDSRGGELFGSQFIKAGIDALAHIARKEDCVTLDVIWLKNGEWRETPLIYTLEGPYLNRGIQVLDAAGRTSPTIDAVHRADMLALIPTKNTPLRDARKLIDHLLIGESRTKDKQWERARSAWIKSGALQQHNGLIRRVVESAP